MKEKIRERYFDSIYGMWTINGLAIVFRVVLGVVFIMAGWAKLPDPETFVRAVRAYDMLPEWAVHLFGYGLPILELILGIALVLGLATKLVAATVGFLLLVFNTAITTVWIRGINVECGCFGGGGEVETAFSPINEYLPHLMTNFAYVLMVIFLLLAPKMALHVYSADGKIAQYFEKGKTHDESTED